MYSHRRRKHFFSSLLLLLTSIAALATAGFLHNNQKKPIIIIDKQDSALNIKKQIIELISLGNKRLITDLIWIQTLIESDLEHYKKKDLNNWLFHRFDSIAHLDKNFYENYLFGGQYLSIIKDDLPGAVSILERGINIYPDSFELRHLLGFTYYFEMSDYSNGLRHLDFIKHHPKAPAFFGSILNKMRLELGFNFEFAIQYLNGTLATTKDEKIAKQIRQDIQNLVIEKDLICLEKNQLNCNLTDPTGKPYLKKNNRYFSPTPFRKYRLRKKGAGAPLYQKSL